MRWVRYRHEGVERSGVIADGWVHASPGDLVGLLTAGDLPAAAEAALASPSHSAELGAVTLLAPVADPPSIRDFMAFEQHVEGMGRLAGAQPRVPDIWYEQPLFYFSNPTSVHGPYAEVAMPPGCAVLDFELEVAAVLGARSDGEPLADLTVSAAADAIAGYVLFNDWSARDLQAREMQGPLGPCKGKDSAITLGPWLLTADELPGLAHGHSDIELTVDVGDRYNGRDRLDSMSWTFAEMISYASRGTRLRPGDVLGSGTCGNGCLAERWGRAGRDGLPPIQVGEVVRMTGGVLGTIANRVVSGAPVVAPLNRRAARTSDPRAQGSSNAGPTLIHRSEGSS